MCAFDVAHGGADLGEPARQQDLCTILRLLGAADLSIARLFEGHVNAISLVARYGTRAHIDRLSQEVADGCLAAVWGADDAAGLKLGEGPGGLQLYGKKILASGAGFVTRPLVTAATDAGQVMCLLKLTGEAPIDLTGWQAQGMHSTATGAIDLTGIAVTFENRIGEPGDFTRQPFFSGGAWRFCAAQVGSMERLTDLFRKHLTDRGRGTDPYQLQRLAQCATNSKTARFWVEEAARRFAMDNSDAAIVAFANLTRMVTERSALDVIESVQRGVGLGAFIRPNPIERICRDLATYLRQPVPDLAMSDAARSFLNASLSVGEF